MPGYTMLRLWARILTAVGVASVVCAAGGVAVWVVSAHGYRDKLAAVLIGAPVAAFLVVWPFALGWAFRAIADIGEAVTFDTSEEVGSVLR